MTAPIDLGAIRTRIDAAATGAHIVDLRDQDAVFRNDLIHAVAILHEIREMAQHAAASDLASEILRLTGGAL